MSISILLSRLRDLDIKVWLDGDQLRINAPKGALTPELQTEIVANKPEIIRFLKDMQAAEHAPARITHHTGREQFPLSFAQQRLWFLYQYEPENTAYSIVNVNVLAGTLDIAILEKSIGQILDRHSVLNAVFTEDEHHQPVQHIPAPVPFHLPVIDLQDLPLEQREEAARDLIAKESQTPLDLLRGPLFRAVLYRVQPRQHFLLVLMHHIVSDGWSMRIFFRELQILYEANHSQKNPPLLEIPVQYADYALWQRQSYLPDARHTALDYWREKLKGPLPILELPGDRPRPPAVTYNGATLRSDLPQELLQRVGQICSQYEVTPFMFLLAAFKVLLHRYTRLEDIIVGTPVANRSQVEVENLIGFFVNTLALRTDLSGNPSFIDLLKRVKETSLEAFTYQDLPFEMVVEAVNPDRDPSHNPIFQVMFIVQNTPRKSIPDRPQDLTFQQMWFDPRTAKFDLTLEIYDNQDGVFYDFEYNTDLFDPGTIQRMLGHYRALIEGVCDDPQQPISQLTLLTAEERQQILVEWNNTYREYPRTKTVQSLVEAQVDRTPQRTAVRDEHGEISFAELDARANQLAHYLRQQGVQPDTLVGLSLPRTAEMVVAMLGILKAGGAYLPLDPNYPPDRLAYMLENAAAPLVITHSSLAARFTAKQARVICLDSDASVISAQPSARFDGGSGPENLAYVIYTSGSTGRPKGVQVLQKGVVNLLTSMQRDLAPTPEDVFLSVTTLSFDIAEMEIYLPLISSALLVLAPNAAAADGTLLRKTLEQSGATFFQATPATLRLLVASGWQGGKDFKILSGGEALAPDLAASLLDRCGALWNGYGPTETSIYSTLCQISPGESLITIGRPIANTQVYLLDANRQPVPAGVPGELYIGGEGVSRGYRNAPQLTTERFIQNPFSTQPDTLYRTGDLVRYLPDGRIDYMGRNDDQVKINGVRIELGEITAALLQHPGVKAAVVVGRKDPAGQSYLAAYVVSQPGETLTTGDLRTYLSGKLPTSMVPARFVFLAQLPLSPNGKVDRKALPEAAAESAQPDIEPQPLNLIEAKLIQIWRKLLNVERVRIEDDFFTLGGHSMLAVRLFIQIKEVFGVNLPLISIFRGSTVQYLAGLIAEEQNKHGLTTWSSLVDLQSNGNRMPLFCIHGMPGDVLWYSRLVAHMAPDQPIWGVQAQGLDGVKEPLTTIEEMAAYYIHEIESIQPQGPYYLCGYSFGGTVAYEMARQLHQQGKEVGLLALIDHASPKSGYHEVKLTPHFVKSFFTNLPYRIADLFNLRGDEIAARIRRILVVTKKSLAAKKAEQPHQHELQASDIIVNADQLSEAAQKLIMTNYQAMQDYFPPNYDGTVTLLRARGGHLFVSHDPQMGWGKYSRSVDIRVIPGSHLGLFREPNIRHLAQELQRCLDETQPDSVEKSSDQKDESQKRYSSRLTSETANGHD